MRLVSVTVQLFRNFVDAQTISIERDVTCLLGKNESGKTTLLKALHRLNPANGTDNRFDLTTEYPRWRLAPDRRANPGLVETAPVQAEFALDVTDIEALAPLLPVPVPAGTLCVATKSYDNELHLDLHAELGAVVDAAANETELTPDDLEAVRGHDTLGAVQSAARSRARELKPDPGTALRATALTRFATALGKAASLVDDGVELSVEAYDALYELLPKFFYFSNYEILPGESDLTELAAKLHSEAALTPEEETVVSLLAHAGETPDDFLDGNYDSRKAELQAASSDLSRQAFQYWRQNPDLAVVFDTDNVRVGPDPNGGDLMHRLLKIELRDARHGDVETNFATRSSGFKWFFSFFAAFSEHQNSDEPMIVLLDEPGTSLHGDAQRDFVSFITEQLAASKQTIYTTHSQHMIDPASYEKLRAVEDRATREEPDLGVVVGPVDLTADRDTLLPVESALGYSVSQHLFLGAGQHLAVEGSSDFVYLQRITEHLIAHGDDGALDPRLAVIPVGGAENMPAFVALLGRRLAITALLDGPRTGRTMDRIQAAAQANGVPDTHIIVCADAHPELPRSADIEDLFTTTDYLKLYNWAYQTHLREQDLPVTTEPLLRRIETIQGKFDHAKPAHALTAHRTEFFAQVDPATIDHFRQLFALLNATLSPASSSLSLAT